MLCFCAIPHEESLGGDSAAAQAGGASAGARAELLRIVPAASWSLLTAMHAETPLQEQHGMGQLPAAL